MKRPGDAPPGGSGSSQSSTAAGDHPSSSRGRGALEHIVACLWFVVVGVAVLLPAIVHASSLGPFDVLSIYGLSKQSGITVHNPIASDQIVQILPWLKLTWTQIHNGHLPLWNAYSGLGMPLAFNWQSAPLAVPSLVSYLFPLAIAFNVQLVTTLFIAGSGVYVLSRVLKMSLFASMFAATLFELSGGFVSWLGWPVASVASWLGWLIAASLLVIGGKRRAWNVTFLAVVLGATILAGQLDILVVVLGMWAVFVLAVLLLRTPKLKGSGPIRRPAVDVALSAVCGFALSAPVALPSLQLTIGSIRSYRNTDAALHLTNLANLVIEGYDGIPIAGQHWFGTYLPFYPDYTAYIGVVAVVLAIVAARFEWLRAEVRALTAVVAVAFLLAFVPLAVAVAKWFPFVSSVHWHRSFIVMVFAIAVLAGFGVDVVIKRGFERPVLGWAAGGFLGVALVLVLLWLFARGGLTAADLRVRNESFIWPGVGCLVGLVVVAGLAARSRHLPGDGGTEGRRPWAAALWVAGLVFFAYELAFLVVAGLPFGSSSTEFFGTTPAIRTLQHSVGSELVAFGAGSCFGFGKTVEYGKPVESGIAPEANAAYGVHEFALYDPMFPRSYYTSWFHETGQRFNYNLAASIFCPAVTSTRVAHLYGVSYVLEPRGKRAPAGWAFIRPVGDEELYHVPGSAQATLTPLVAGRGLPPDTAPAAPVPVRHPEAATWEMETSSSSAQVLRLRLTSVPGWHATIDGRPLQLEKFAGVMLEARIPPGSHVIKLTYMPVAFLVGVVLAGMAILGLVGGIVVTNTKRSLRRRIRT